MRLMKEIGKTWLTSEVNEQNKLVDIKDYVVRQTQLKVSFRGGQTDILMGKEATQQHIFNRYYMQQCYQASILSVWKPGEGQYSVVNKLYKYVGQSKVEEKDR